MARFVSVERQITVAELIRALEGMDQSAKVWVEGCDDCYGEATGVDADNDGVTIRRL